jgi:hypothetical protein
MTVAPVSVVRDWQSRASTARVLGPVARRCSSICEAPSPLGAGHHDLAVNPGSNATWGAGTCHEAQTFFRSSGHRVARGIEPLVEPGAGEGTEAAGGAERVAQSRRGLVGGQPRKIAELDDLGGFRFLGGELIEGFVERQQFVGQVAIDAVFRSSCRKPRFCSVVETLA